MSIFILLFFDILLAATGQLLLKHGMNQIGELDFSLANVGTLITSAIKSLHIWLALIAYGLAMILWLFVLSKTKLSVAYPATATIFVLIVASSWVLLKEQITGLQLVGIAVILLGMFFLFKGSSVLS